mgnify:CR=1 FL=1
MCAENNTLPAPLCKAQVDARLAETPVTDGKPYQVRREGHIACRLEPEMRIGYVPQTPQSHWRVVCADNTALPAPECKLQVDARYAETPATDGNPLQFGHWVPS